LKATQVNVKKSNSSEGTNSTLQATSDEKAEIAVNQFDQMMEQRQQQIIE
jgi:hypothetical protein